MLSFLTKFLTTCILFYGLLALLMYSFQRQMIFHPQDLDDQDRAQFQSYQISFSSQGVELYGWYLDSNSKDLKSKDSSKPLLIYYGGNAEEISWNIPYFQQFFDASLLLVNYRGYGVTGR
ncbi:MAG: hypothetical protein OQK12_15945 [Motiliproteus sp.]|nr:hypothetical protein [Motiliproteus sp.]MCW9051428.1 hypothetical protein [Motiliproteus sp.]